MRVGVGSDHHGFKLKEEALFCLQLWGFDVKDFGTLTEDPCDYPKFAYALGKAIARKEIDRGVLICNTGIGMSIAANKVNGVRAARCVNWQEAKLCCEENAANVLCVGDDADISLIMEAWLGAEFLVEHAKRVTQISQIESAP